MTDFDLDPGYVAARGVLLDALDALGSQTRAMVLAGAQAIYLRTGPESLPIAEYTTDGDLTVEPGALEEAPLLAELMEGADFKLAVRDGSDEPGIWEKDTEVDGIPLTVPIDLIVPTGAAAPGGRRGARLGVHGNRAARKAVGLEAALVDNDVMTIKALDAGDDRKAELRVAGIAALLVAKTHKLSDRVEAGRFDRLEDKDAADVVRLMQASSAAEVATTLAFLAAHPVAGEATQQAIERFPSLFGNRAGIGIEMAARSLRGVIPEDRVRLICIAYSDQLREGLTS
ncbi:MAG TPA: hypothetical protein VFJ57_02890 [Solirubrobacterales bacterium]|nr:hypothetical protein [Solirubrobacterales bacterium]